MPDPLAVEIFERLVKKSKEYPEERGVTGVWSPEVIRRELASAFLLGAQAGLTAAQLVSDRVHARSSASKN